MDGKRIVVFLVGYELRLEHVGTKMISHGIYFMAYSSRRCCSKYRYYFDLITAPKRMTFNHVFFLPIFGVSFAIFVYESLNMSMNGSKYLLTFVTQSGLQNM